MALPARRPRDVAPGEAAGTKVAGRFEAVPGTLIGGSKFPWFFRLIMAPHKRAVLRHR